jgi:hypothetical protein
MAAAAAAAAAAAVAPRHIFHELEPGGDVSDETDFEEFAGPLSPRRCHHPAAGRFAFYSKSTTNIHKRAARFQ